MRTIHFCRNAILRIWKMMSTPQYTLFCVRMSGTLASQKATRDKKTCPHRVGLCLESSSIYPLSHSCIDRVLSQETEQRERHLLFLTDCDRTRCWCHTLTHTYTYTYIWMYSVQADTEDRTHNTHDLSCSTGFCWVYISYTEEDIDSCVWWPTIITQQLNTNSIRWVSFSFYFRTH